MTDLHPLLAAALDREVEADYLAVVPGVGTNAAHVGGRLSLVVDGDDIPVEVAVESDGGATFIPLRRLLGLRLAGLEVLS